MIKSRRYPVKLEVAGPLAMFARPDTGAMPVSYPLPTPSACKGLFESIARLSSGDAWIEPTAVEICKRVGEPGGEIVYQQYATNYGGPLRKGSQISGGNSFQFFATILVDVCYRLHGAVVARGRERGGRNSRHYLQDLFNRRLTTQGRCFRTPCLGWSEFTCNYWGPFRDGTNGQPSRTEVDMDLNFTVPSLLGVMWSEPVDGEYHPTFVRNAVVRSGRLDFESSIWAQREESHAQ